MDQEKFGKLIKEIRKKNNLTQKALADKLNVTYQAVSKWETGKNMPDKAVLKQISKEFNVSLDSMFDGNYKNNKKNNSKYVIIFMGVILVLLIILISLLFIFHDHDFNYKNLSSNCDDFKITGSISYNSNKSAIFISNVEYCGDLVDDTIYEKIECSLYETSDNVEVKLTTYKDQNKTLSEFLNEVSFSFENKDNICKTYDENSLYLLISAQDSNGKITTYKIPLSVDSCNN